jgi:hypothetical protein|uniref:DUF3789 domain-containing protein n=1 Tax=Siphoviridae sp. ctQtc11 TaxID=2825497 RepID=A0A8S5P2Z5_9CAUD|nr:MAG TPA: hypothetical protein [Siphoviridae sp. ctQtc11]
MNEIVDVIVGTIVMSLGVFSSCALSAFIAAKQKGTSWKDELFNEET